MLRSRLYYYLYKKYSSIYSLIAILYYIKNYKDKRLIFKLERLL